MGRTEAQFKLHLQCKIAGKWGEPGFKSRSDSNDTFLNYYPIVPPKSPKSNFVIKVLRVLNSIQ